MKKKLRSIRRVYFTKQHIDVPTTLILWWGSYGFSGGPTIGDLMAVDNLSRHLTSAGVEHAIVSHSELGFNHHFNVTDIYSLKPAKNICFVCGPLMANPNLVDFLKKQIDAKKSAVGVSVLYEQSKFNRQFDLIVPRDGVAPSYFDLAVSKVSPVEYKEKPKSVGVCLRGNQKEYGKDRLSLAKKALDMTNELIKTSGLEPVFINTVLSKTNTAEYINNQFRSVDLMFTTRMHGTLLSLAAGKPVIALDQIPGGAKVADICKKVNWPYIFSVESTTQEMLTKALKELQAPDIKSKIIISQEKIIDLTNEALAVSVKAISRFC